VWTIVAWTAMSNVALAVSLLALRSTGAFLLARDELIVAEWANATRPSTNPRFRTTTAQSVTIVRLFPAEWR
jgi:hypothetical protein